MCTGYEKAGWKDIVYISKCRRNPMKIIFYSNQLCERGTETALIDYGVANKEILGNETIFCFPKDKIFDADRYDLLKNDFEVFLFSEIGELVGFYKNNNVDLLYIIAGGADKDIADELEKYNVKTFVHCVFSTARRHGTYYCAIHQFLNIHFNTRYPVLPHIVKKLPELTDNLRKELGIPENALVFGGYGGKPSFDISYVHEAIKEIAEQRKDIYFLFMNFEDFMNKDFNLSLKNVIFLPGTTDCIYKRKFINTCDAMLHARSNGETFGLSCAEFSICNKPVISYIPPKKILKRQLKDMLNNYFGKNKVEAIYAFSHVMNMWKGGIILFYNKKSLFRVILNFKKRNKDYDCFSKRFNAEKVIKKFAKIIK